MWSLLLECQMEAAVSHKGETSWKRQDCQDLYKTAQVQRCAVQYQTLQCTIAQYLAYSTVHKAFPIHLTSCMHAPCVQMRTGAVEVTSVCMRAPCAPPRGRRLQRKPRREKCPARAMPACNLGHDACLGRAHTMSRRSDATTGLLYCTR